MSVISPICVVSTAVCCLSFVNGFTREPRDGDVFIVMSRNRRIVRMFSFDNRSYSLFEKKFVCRLSVHEGWSEMGQILFIGLPEGRGFDS
ncbi:MAG: hypothetical protein ACLVL2_13665 [Bacteroides cellulosilyticus]